MNDTIVLVSGRAFVDTFARCCKEFDALHMAVAWSGDPALELPFRYIEDFAGTLKVTVGVAFLNTNPDGLDWFRERKVDLRIFDPKVGMFHPKVFFFTKGKRFALLLGSSNFTYGGFLSNVEADCLVEGELSSGGDAGISLLQAQLDYWHSSKCSLKPDTEWMEQYRKKYEKIRRAAKKSRVPTPPDAEQTLGQASWLRHGDWELFFRKVTEGLEEREGGAAGYHAVLNAAEEKLPLPWKVSYFADLERRKVVGGQPPYGWLGHVAAWGKFRGLLANGDPKQLKTLVRCINDAASQDAPLDWQKVRAFLDELKALGPSMKVWGRLLCLVRPDLYCTVSSKSVSRNLAQTLKVAQEFFETPEGYIELLKLAHGAPWYGTTKKFKNKAEAAIFARRMAFIDAIFYDE